MIGLQALKLPLSLEKVGPREFLYKICIDILVGYRLNCTQDSPKTQLILPESLKVLPLYILGMLKHPALLDNVPGSGSYQDSALSGGASPNRPVIKASERAFELTRLLTLPVRQIVRTLYPR